MPPKSPLAGVDDAPELPPWPTAASVASTHFASELERHSDRTDTSVSNTIVILHDNCYGHRFSRPRTSKTALSTIVERPERIHASILGMSMAYVRLGDRHVEGQYPPLLEGNPRQIPTVPFRIRKTDRKLDLASTTVTNVHGIKWMEELKIMCDTAESKLAMNGKELARPDMNRGSDQGPAAKFHEGDLYLCSESLNAMEGALGAVCEGVDAVFEGAANGMGPRRTFVAIRPPGHHCSASYPSGFCWLNNVHVGISHATLIHGLTHAAIIDFDLHHGDGSQAITWQHNARVNNLAKNAAAWKKSSIGYFSLHDINSYPCEMGDEEKVKNASLCIENAHGQSIWNVHLQPWKTEAEFWELYESKYSVLLEKTRNYLRNQTQRVRMMSNNLQPKGAIFLSAGFDASEWESDGMQRHKVNVPTEFYARLTRDVVKIAEEEGTSVDGRIISVLEGGYSDRALASGVMSHISGLAGKDPVAVKNETASEVDGQELSQKLEGLGLQENHGGSLPYDPRWWSRASLDQLDNTINPPPPPPEPKAPVNTIAPTYSSPTQSFTAKIVHTPKPRRTVSSTSNISISSPRPAVRVGTPPPTDVDWATAAHELSKLLIPSDRETKSCRPEDLSAEATRARRDRQSLLTPPASTVGVTPTTTPSTRMSLRERRAPKTSFAVDEEAAAAITEKPVSRASRRRTVAGPAVIAAEKVSPYGVCSTRY
jgi:histone deacetylase HOS3